MCRRRRFFGPDFGARAVTNVETRTAELWAWTNCQSVIEMTLTNGTRNVYTNSWRAFGVTNKVTETVTNVWPRHADFAYHIFTNGVVAGSPSCVTGSS